MTRLNSAVHAGENDIGLIPDPGLHGAELSPLYRPIVFTEPDRSVDPASWLEHVPFAFWIVDALQPDIFVELAPLGK